MRGMWFSAVLVMVALFLSFLQTVGDAEQGQGVRLARPALALSLRDPLLDGPTGDRAIRADVVRIVLSHLPEDRPADLHRRIVELALDAPGPVVARAALDGIDRRAG